MPAEQLTIPLGPVRNFFLFSNHWLENRLREEPEWQACRDDAAKALAQLGQLWKKEASLVEHYGDEQGLEEKFIQPALEALGWEFKYQALLQNREPDYALFLDHDRLAAAVQAGRASAEFWQYPTVVADAKAWHVSLDRPRVVGAKREYPPEQIEWYLDKSRLDYGVLSNGKTWRLVPREYGPSQRRFLTYLECDLPAILKSWLAAKDRLDKGGVLDDFLYFYLFFSPAGFRETDGRKPLIVRAREGSSEYRVGVGEGLRERTFEALRLCIEGFLTYRPNQLDAQNDLVLCRVQTFVLLYRLLFIMFAEDRRLLPYRVNRTYTKNRSLGRLRDDIAAQVSRRIQHENTDQSTALWDELQDLFDLVDKGKKTYGVPEYNGGLFDPTVHEFLAEKKMSDKYLAQVIDKLGRAPDPNLSTDELFRVDYHDLAIQHLGDIYEGLLELHPHHATERMVVVSRRAKNRIEERIVAASQEIPEGFERTDTEYRPGSIYLQTDKGERRASGSYYTPDHIVNYIVENTLGPICQKISRELDAEIQGLRKGLVGAKGKERAELASGLERLQADFGNRVLRLRVLDPASGSGHFLLRACQYLAEEIATHPYAGDESASATNGESSLTFWKRRVVEHCLYGVDLNGLAVELSKLALWLETVAAEQPLSFLDHHLRHGNSLVGARVAELSELPGAGRLMLTVFAEEVERSLPAFLDPLAKIRRLPSDRAENVKTKEQLYQAFEQAREPFRVTADLWCSTFGENPEQKLKGEEYRQAIELLRSPTEFDKLRAESWFQRAHSRARQADMTPCHWELEFPEAFFDGTSRRQNPGFDAVIGNPPYDVLSELESGHDLTALRAFIDQEPIYEPSKGGKNNLYKLFVCRALDLLAEGGYLGFITPMAILGDEQAANLRRHVLKLGRFGSIEAFPQKDDAENRVFREAKLSTTVFTVIRDGSDEGREQPFRSRVHSGRDIEGNSPALTLRTASIPLYDPENMTVVSCSQVDWDLATRMVSSGRMHRLGRYAEFFQGEVNETNERKRGNLAKGPTNGKLVTRGASICLYAVRPASQGEDLYVNVESFLRGRTPDSKAFHHRYPRVGLQESSPQNNFRRIIAAMIPADEFCNHTVNYCPQHKCSVDLRLLLAVLNSKLADWYFRLGSTNAHVSHYQLYNLPFPSFGQDSSADSAKAALDCARRGKLQDIPALLQAGLTKPPFAPAIRDVIVACVSRVLSAECERGDIARVERSALDPAAQPYQDVIDQLLFRLAGLTAGEAVALEGRLRNML